MINQGNGLFAPIVRYASGESANSLALSDLNGDGRLDLAASNPSGNRVNVLFGNGDGTFGTRTGYPVGSSPYSVTVNDFNGDGKPDIAAANNSGGTISVLKNNGNGTFAAKVDYPSPRNLYEIASGDFNGDGRVDLAVTVSDNDRVIIYFGKGDGTFLTDTYFISFISPYGIAASDFNSDGNLDLATTNFRFAGNTYMDNRITVLLNLLPPVPVSASSVLAFEGSPAGTQNTLFEFRPVGGSTVVSRSAKVAVNGLFSVADLPRADYTLHIKPAKFLAENVVVHTATGSVSGITATLRSGNANGDNSVNVLDFFLIAVAYETRTGDAYFDARADLNGDGEVNTLDFALTVNRFNEDGSL